MKCFRSVVHVSLFMLFISPLLDTARLLSVPRSSIHRLRVGQEPAVLALGVGGVVWTILSFPFSPPPEDGSIKTEILPQRTGKPKTTNQHSTVGISVHLGVRMCIFCLIFLCDGQQRVQVSLPCLVTGLFFLQESNKNPLGTSGFDSVKSRE